MILQKVHSISLIIALIFSGINQAKATDIYAEGEHHQLSKITSVSQLSNVKANSWAWQTLANLSQKYNCPGFENFANNQTLSRYEFAAKLNACILQINEMSASGKLDKMNREDLAIIQKLQAKFAAELVTFKQKLDLLDNKVTGLEAQQFSPNIKLEGEVIFAVTGVAGGKKANSNTKEINENLVLSDRFRLSLETSFTGKDRLQLRLQGRNTPELADVTNTQMANLGFDGDDDNEIEIDELDYKFALGKETRVTLYATGGGLGDFVPSVNSLFSSSGEGSISTFGKENPIRRQSGGAGIGISHNFHDSLNLSLGYISNDAADPERGLFASPYGAIAQITLEPSKTTAISLTYTHSYNNVGTGTGSELTSDPFSDKADAITANSFGAEAAWQLNSTITLGGRVGFIHAQAEDLPATPNAIISTWALMLALRDIGTKGSFAGFIVGQPPKVTYNSFGNAFEDKDTSLHLEAFYKFKISDNVSITPGLFVITNPEHSNGNDDIFVGTVRTTFSF
ncbi:carbohydrate porin [Calothrix sp. FACHB-1219]|uniref:iron uptake porin n=1 Tax=unclassified Calothrix TaxID=2619626 RepID=UPI001682CDEC|nr:MULTISPECIES: iron uptake porin [unclassified Calothrix]MBD2205865.1 carbohydrate porin [Calothrix sp. FACHB-168]MBD2220694.1 carbohydrate porin [Calothrix sp. FACHB-1219]